MSTRERFGARLAKAVASRGPLCAGIDPHPGLIEAWGLPVDASGLERFALSATEVLAARAAIVKPQSAFFESFGAAGIRVLERVVETARDAGALVLLDVKRGDIGSTMAAYTAAYVADGAAIAADAITVSPYLGFGSLEQCAATAVSAGRGIFVLARTSNPEAAAVQNAKLPDGRTVAQAIVDSAAALNAGAEPLGDVGVVVGATIAPGEARSRAAERSGAGTRFRGPGSHCGRSSGDLRAGTAGSAARVVSRHPEARSGASGFAPSGRTRRRSAGRPAGKRPIAGPGTGPHQAPPHCGRCSRVGTVASPTQI
ncbi:orotidine-5'-phosphate decarboxylase [Amycolatopsis nalaikhensis]|uniref:Orotidine-5'-phosphate decarboxylase n=1 Tax=Amycolatopsis nalaikhensis TaxID=715472 RepID=A0ABY8XLP8_9PSEU|nr:orotidine-5'-phosphate decarboxylase [Amycolatopsis sp. 2-2]WIV56565.1 orotidine-5'-phosphate decarboxylase [Amycolatopsis sp. 2-2]